MQHESHNKRYIDNTYNYNEINENETVALLYEKLIKLTEDQVYKYPPDSQEKLFSTGKLKTDFSIYTGSGGNIYVYWKYYLMCKNFNSQETETAFANFSTAFEANVKLIESTSDKREFDSSAFFHSYTGIYALGCIFACETDDEKLFFYCLRNVLDIKKDALSAKSEDELLYGNAGYLYSLLLIKQNCGTKFNLQIDSDIAEVVNNLIENGIENMKKHKTNFLIFPFPRTKGHLYLGGAHGMMGVLYLILSAIKLCKKESFEERVLNFVESSLTNLAKLQTESGNFPSSLESMSDNLVHFCHGATGAVYLFSLASEIFNNKSYLDVVLKAGNLIWEKGLLRKGNGVCHGITGNAYALHKIFMVTKDKSYKQKALCFASALFDEQIQNKCSHYVDKQRKVIGVPDSPFSLMEGQGGAIVFLSELLIGDNFVLFPGFQVSNAV